MTQKEFDALAEKVAGAFGFSKELMTGPSKNPEICGARRLLMRLMRDRELTLDCIGSFLNRGNSTVHQSIRAFDRQVRIDPPLARLYQTLGA